MPKKKSAGLLLYRHNSGQLEVLLVHMGGPYWDKKDDGAWSIPKGEFTDDEDPLNAAKREFEEETGTIPVGDFIPLEPLRQPSGKTIYAWAVNADFDCSGLRSNLFSLEWPPKSGNVQEFPEIDRACWFTPQVGKQKILKGQAPFIEQLQAKVEVTSSSTPYSSSAKSRQGALFTDS